MMLKGLYRRQHGKKDMNRLSKLVPLIKKVHGKDHPELLTVHELFIQLKEVITQADAHLKVAELFSEIEKVTNHFVLPADACPAYKETYEILEKMNEQIKSQ